MKSSTMGVCIYNSSEQPLLYLNDKKQNILDLIFKKINTALKHRKSFSVSPESLRLAHHYHDGLPHTVIDKYNNIYCIRTYC